MKIAIVGLRYRSSTRLSPMDKLWIDLEGKLIPVAERHDEYANAIGNDLETLLDAGWVRFQNVPPLTSSSTFEFLCTHNKLSQ